jgi:hypothetical protein
LSESSHFLTSAAAEKVAVWETQDILKQRGALVDPQAIRRILDKIPDVEPEHEWDCIPHRSNCSEMENSGHSDILKTFGIN